MLQITLSNTQLIISTRENNCISGFCQTDRYSEPKRINYHMYLSNTRFGSHMFGKRENLLDLQIELIANVALIEDYSLQV